MKKTLLTVLFGAFALSAFGQYAAIKKMVDIDPASGYYQLQKAINTTNIPSSDQEEFALNGNGVAMFVNMGSTNAVTSNVVFRFEFSADNACLTVYYFPKYYKSDRNERTRFAVEFARHQVRQRAA